MGQKQKYAGTGNLDLPQIPSEFPIKRHLMPGFLHILIGVGTLCDANCAVTFMRKAFIVCNKQGTVILTGWREATGPRLPRIALQPGESKLPSMPNDAKQAPLAASSAYDLPNVADLIRYFHAAAGYPVRSTWIKNIGAGNYLSCTGLTLTNATKYFPSAKATIMGKLVQKRQGVRSTNLKHPPPSSPEVLMPRVRFNNFFLQVTPISKFYTENTGRFPVKACTGYQYVMIA